MSLEPPRREGAHILVVDDSAETRDVVRDLLESAGYAVATAASGADALNTMTRDAPPALVILDLLMPGIDGFSLRVEMLRRPELAAIPVIVLSGYWHRPKETLEAVAVFEKPIDLDRFLDAVRGQLGEGQGVPIEARADARAG